ncbi:MAG: hypothetical protein H7062_17895, partial [Candidatus Saccharimonas sp.]|nr:hypothetical protein [Planctomycetaceae bacterium]
QKRATNKAPKTLAQRIEPLIRCLTTEEDNDEPSEPVSPFAVVAALEVLALAGARLRPEQLWKLWRHSLSQVVQLIRTNTDEDAHDPTIPADVQLIERGELPFVAGVLFGDVAGAMDLVKTGRKALARSLVENADSDGTPRAEMIERLPLWLAPLIRASLIAKRFDVKLWTNDQEQTLMSAVERAIPLCRPDGKSALSNGLSLEPLPVLVAAAELFHLPEISPEGGYLQSVKRVIAGQPARRVRNDGVVTMPSNQSDWARFALLRSDWSMKADSVAVAHHRQFPQIDVTAAGKPLLHGDWTLELKLGDTVVELAEEWSCVCWQSDPDADYIELQMRGPGKLRVERIIMLSRKERFLLLADSISGAPSGRIEYCATLPLADDILVRLDRPTREAQLTMKGFKARVFPLAVTQDRVHSTPHEFTATGERLTLKQVAQGEGLFAPVLLDWHPNRTRADAQWRSLTVTEDGRVIGPDIAAGHRLKLGDLQLLIFRSLKTTGESRAVLGHHTHNETVIARVDKKGDIDPILLVEPA